MSLPLVKPWNRFWFSPVSARPLGVFRIVFGLVCFLNYALLWPEADLWLSDAGWLRGPEAAQVAGWLRPSPLLFWQDPLMVRAVLGLAMVVSLLLAAGWHSRTVSVVFYLLALSVHHRNLLTCAGPDAVLMNFAFLMMFCPSGAAFSIDARRRSLRRGILAEPLVLPWAQRLMQLQVSLIYFSTALYKASGTSWADGSALHLVLSNGGFRRFTLGLLDGPPELVILLTQGALALEFTLPFLLWFRPTRPYLIASGVALHTAIALTVNIPIFGELMVASYLLFLSPEELQALLGFFDARRLFARQSGTKTVEIPGRLDGPSPPPTPHFPGTGVETGPVHETLSA